MEFFNTEINPDLPRQSIASEVPYEKSEEDVREKAKKKIKPLDLSKINPPPKKVIKTKIMAKNEERPKQMPL